MNWVGVTCLSIVCPSGNLYSLPPYFAETSFQVPTSLLSGFASFFSCACTLAVGTASTTITARQTVAILPIGSPPRGNTQRRAVGLGTLDGCYTRPDTGSTTTSAPFLVARDARGP